MWTMFWWLRILYTHIHIIIIIIIIIIHRICLFTHDSISINDFQLFSIALIRMSHLLIVTAHLKLHSLKSKGFDLFLQWLLIFKRMQSMDNFVIYLTSLKKICHHIYHDIQLINIPTPWYREEMTLPYDTETEILFVNKGDFWALRIKFNRNWLRTFHNSESIEPIRVIITLEALRLKR